jgi:hypothetical protein
MKRMKMVGLVVVAAMALMAFAAGTASATTLLSGTKILPAGTRIEATLAGSTELKETGVNGQALNTCPFSEFWGSTNLETGSVLSVLASYRWSLCTNTTTTLNGGKLTISYTSGLNGTVVSDGTETTVLSSSASCVYGSATFGTTLGTLVGSFGGNATLEVNAVTEKKSGSFLCPSSAVWKGNYAFTSPSPLAVAS